MGERLTRQDVRKIEDEIRYRTTVVQQEALESLKEARAQGDLSENFEYKAAKQFKGQNESRVRYLENVLKHATIISDNSKSDEAGLNDIVEVWFEEDEELETYKLVTSIRGASTDNKVSIESPLGKALLRHHVGDRIQVNLENGSNFYVEIRSITKNDDENEEIRRY
ncbi:MAG: GreA/GreB family elongation factor [Blautia sp.]|nr:GreA/GreB family elongation factor [Blautia sp.]